MKKTAKKTQKAQHRIAQTWRAPQPEIYPEPEKEPLQTDVKTEVAHGSEK